jgi:esterase/lipase superfamily enzyme
MRTQTCSSSENQVGRIGPSLACVAASTALLLAGCASPPADRIELMPVPAVFAGGRFEPFDAVPPKARRLETEILFATDRDPATEADLERHYASRRGHLVRLGRAHILHGDGELDWDSATRLSLQSPRKPPYRLRVDAVEEIGILAQTVSPFTDPALLPADPGAPAAAFAAAVDRKLARSRQRDILIYVHGFKVPFENPLLVATELWHFLGYDGVVIPYSWPATPRLVAYFSDVETTALSAHYLKEFIQFLRERTSAERVHILGYSAGTRLVLDALSMLALTGESQGNGARIGEVILVGSDVDSGLFAAALTNGILDTSERLTVYLSEIDGALRFANLVFGRDRLGQLLDHDMPSHVAATLDAAHDLVLIDVTDAEDADARSGHSYFRDSPWVSSDILATLATGLGPAERGLVRRRADVPIWRYPPDFIARLQRALATQVADLSNPMVKSRGRPVTP